MQNIFGTSKYLALARKWLSLYHAPGFKSGFKLEYDADIICVFSSHHHRPFHILLALELSFWWPKHREQLLEFCMGNLETASLKPLKLLTRAHLICWATLAFSFAPLYTTMSNFIKLNLKWCSAIKSNIYFSFSCFCLHQNKMAKHSTGSSYYLYWLLASILITRTLA